MNGIEPCPTKARSAVPLGKPAFSGAMFGHIAQKRTLPVGTMAEIDAEAGTIELLEPAVI